jgi:hypothetical protein
VAVAVPETVVVAAAPGAVAESEAQPEAALVWKEPEAIISHDTEVFLKGVKDLNAAPSLVTPTTETRTTDPENPVTEEVLAPVALVAAGPIDDLATKPVESKTLESVAKPAPLSDEGVVVPTPRSSEPALPASNGSSQKKKPMNKESNPQFDTLVTDVVNIIFGENAPEINVRLVRMALEQVWANRANLQSLDAIAKEIARIIFGEGATSDLNVRLVRMALERSNSIALFKAA